MSAALQIALFFASVAIIVFVVCFLIALMQLRKSMQELGGTMAELKSDLKDLTRDTHTLVQSVNALSERAHEQWTEVEKIVRTVRGWSERADHIVDEIGSVIEPPIRSAARNIGIFRKGLAVFLQALTHKNKHNQEEEEDSHV